MDSHKNLFSTRAPFPSLLGLVFVIALAGCGRNSRDTNAQLDQAVRAMAHAKSTSTMAVGDSSTTPAPTPLQQMNEALASYKNGDFESAVTRFQNIRVHTPMTGEQILALNDALAAVMSDLYSRAAKGDAAAAQAVRQYEQMQRQRR